MPAARDHFLLLPESLDDAYGDLIQLGYPSPEEGAELNQQLKDNGDPLEGSICAFKYPK